MICCAYQISVFQTIHPLVFEYSLFERPMIFFAYDKAEYDDWRGFYYNYEEMTPGPICTENEEMLDYIQHLNTRFDHQQVADFKYKFMRSCDGHATEQNSGSWLWGDMSKPEGVMKNETFVCDSFRRIMKRR